MIRIDEKGYYSVMYFYEWAGEPSINGSSGGNFMGMISCPDKEDQSSWEFTYRFRYYVDNEIHDSQDIKNWTGFKAKGTEEKIVSACDEVFYALLNALKKDYSQGTILGEVTAEHRIVVQGDCDRWQELALGGGFPWMHVTREEVLDEDEVLTDAG